MPRDFADRAMLRRGRRGALVSRMPATGSSLPGGSPITIGMRKRLIRAQDAGKPILVRASDDVCIRAATFDEVVKAYKSYDGRILVSDVIGTDGAYGCMCFVKRWPTLIDRHVDPEMEPRLVKDRRKKERK